MPTAAYAIKIDGVEVKRVFSRVEAVVFASTFYGSTIREIPLVQMEESQ